VFYIDKLKISKNYFSDLMTKPTNKKHSTQPSTSKKGTGTTKLSDKSTAKYHITSVVSVVPKAVVPKAVVPKAPITLPKPPPKQKG
jgi:hypothetical protein